MRPLILLRTFCSKSSTIPQRCGGEHSYIGFGKFESMTNERGDIHKGLEYLRDAFNAHLLNPPSYEHSRLTV